MRYRILSVCVGFALCSAMLAQEPSLGDVARASRARQASSPKPAKVFSNEESSPQAIKDGEDSLEVFTRARTGFLHDTSHRCQQESSDNRLTIEVAAVDRMRLSAQAGAQQEEWIMEGDSYYHKTGGAWRKLTDPQEVAQGRFNFHAAIIPQPLQFGFQPGDLKPQGDQVIEGVRTVLYTFITHTYEMNRTVNLWIGKADSLPYRIDMRTESKERNTPARIWGESTTCRYGVEIKIEPPL